MVKRSLAILLALGSWLTSVPGLASSRTNNDVVIMNNGDRITCEIKSLTQGELSVKPDYTNASIVLDWTKVARLESSQQFVVSDPNGAIYSGSLVGESKTKSLTVTGESETVTLNTANVVQIDQLGTTFTKRLRGDVDLGTSFAKSNSQKNLTLQTDLGYQSIKWLFHLSTSTQYSSQLRATDTRETSIKSSGFRQLRESNWYAGGIGNFLSSSEQQIDLRSTLGAAMARRQIFTNKTNLNFIGGLAYTREQDSATATSTPRQNSLDGVLAVTYNTFRFDALTFNTSVWAYPGITSAGRIRLTINQDVYYKFLSDFYVRLSFYDNYDNQSAAGAPSNNLGATTTLGWSFH